MLQVSPEAGEKSVAVPRAPEGNDAGGLDKLLPSGGGEELAELGMHSAFLSIACNVFPG
ncbi:MAG TPA: hypothetical protein VN880_04825 [Solirubrobacteraceae bacterium]|jgi:hypothetical protein|nr:hypothetical protein [Solirubrobacteraceae bacterium]